MHFNEVTSTHHAAAANEQVLHPFVLDCEWGRAVLKKSAWVQIMALPLASCVTLGKSIGDLLLYMK